jgi:DNA-binding NtrC family response regulator
MECAIMDAPISKMMGSQSTACSLVYAVDDDPEITGLMEAIMYHIGIPTRTFNNPAKALKALMEAPIKPLLLITDYDMGSGRWSGVDLIRECHKICPGLKTMIISGSIEPSKTYEFGVAIDGFLPKPFNYSDMIRVAQGLLASAGASVPGYQPKALRNAAKKA